MTAVTTPKQGARIPELDGIRGIAISLVLVFHYIHTRMPYQPRYLFYLARLTGLTWSGVDLFFVLSGLLIGGILLDARRSLKYFSTFYARRAIRILPLVFALYVVAIVLDHAHVLRGFQADVPG